MDESGINLNFDLDEYDEERILEIVKSDLVDEVLSQIPNSDLQNFDYYELRSKAVQLSPSLEESPTLKNEVVRSRTQLKQQLMRDQELQIEQEKRRRAELTAKLNRAIAEPVQIPLNVSNVRVPPHVLEVKSALQNPTRYHILAKQKNQVLQFLSNSPPQDFIKKIDAEKASLQLRHQQQEVHLQIQHQQQIADQQKQQAQQQKEFEQQQRQQLRKQLQKRKQIQLQYQERWQQKKLDYIKTLSHDEKLQQLHIMEQEHQMHQKRQQRQLFYFQRQQCEEQLERHHLMQEQHQLERQQLLQQHQLENQQLHQQFQLERQQLCQQHEKMRIRHQSQKDHRQQVLQTQSEEEAKADAQARDPEKYARSQAFINFFRNGHYRVDSQRERQGRAQAQAQAQAEAQACAQTQAQAQAQAQAQMQPQQQVQEEKEKENQEQEEVQKKEEDLSQEQNQNMEQGQKEEEEKQESKYQEMQQMQEPEHQEMQMMNEPQHQEIQMMNQPQHQGMQIMNETQHQGMQMMNEPQHQEMQMMNEPQHQEMQMMNEPQHQEMQMMNEQQHQGMQMMNEPQHQEMQKHTPQLMLSPEKKQQMPEIQQNGQAIASAKPSQNASPEMVSPVLNSVATSFTSDADDALDALSFDNSSAMSDKGNGSTVWTQSMIAAMPNADNTKQKISHSCPSGLQNYAQELAPIGESNPKDRIKKDNHNIVERRRRSNINERIKELGALLPKTNDPHYDEVVRDSKQNKGSILKSSVDYIKILKHDIQKFKQIEIDNKKLQEENRGLLLRIQELEKQAEEFGLTVQNEIWQMIKPDTLLASILKNDWSPRSQNNIDAKPEGDAEAAAAAVVDAEASLDAQIGAGAEAEPQPGTSQCDRMEEDTE